MKTRLGDDRIVYVKFSLPRVGGDSMANITINLDLNKIRNGGSACAHLKDIKDVNGTLRVKEQHWRGCEVPSFSW